MLDNSDSVSDFVKYHSSVEEVRGVIVGGNYQRGALYYEGRRQEAPIWINKDHCSDPDKEMQKISGKQRKELLEKYPETYKEDGWELRILIE